MATTGAVVPPILRETAANPLANTCATLETSIADETAKAKAMHT